MRIVHTECLCGGSFQNSFEWKSANAEIETAIKCVDWPHGSGSFTINPILKGNGVNPIKIPCVNHLCSKGWRTEALPKMGTVLGTGDLDALREFDSGKSIGFEWETGNISSSHRALNKLMLAMKEGHLQGVLVLPARHFARYLTDRIGNYEELLPYFPLFRDYPLEGRGVLQVIAVAHDNENRQVELIPKGKDGNAEK
jgi:hypothetical protein